MTVKKGILIPGILILIILVLIVPAYRYRNRTLIRVSNVPDAHVSIESGGKSLYSRKAEQGYWQVCSAEIDRNRLTLKIAPPEEGCPQREYGSSEIQDSLIDLRGDGDKRFLVLTNVINPGIPERAVFYFFDAKDNFAFYGTREYIGELGASFVYPNPELVFNSYAETGYWENAGGSFITIQNRLAKGGNQYISSGKPDFKKLYLKYRSLKQQLEQRNAPPDVTAELVLFSIWSDLFTYDNGWTLARRFAFGLGYRKNTVDSVLEKFAKRLQNRKEAEPVHQFNPDFPMLFK